MVKKRDLIVIGGGVLGSFHAYHALMQGLDVALVEKDMVVKGATVRNFGQVVPSGMDVKWQRYGRESLNIYKEIQSKFDISVRVQGSVYIASNSQELQLLHELKVINDSENYSAELLSKKQLLNTYGGIKKTYAKAGLFFDQELVIEPSYMIHRLLDYLKESGLHLFMGQSAIGCVKKGSGVEVQLSNGHKLLADKVIVCNGSDFESLFPELFLQSDLELVKLQMMATVPQPKDFKLPGSVLTGWTIRRYEAFSQCPSYDYIKALEALDSPQKKWGVHILFKQAVDGSVIIGDSHQYALLRNRGELGFDLDMDIDRFILKSAKNICDLPQYKIARRWYGMYNQSISGDVYQKTLEEDIHIVTGIGGKGMTGSPGFAKEHVSELFNL